MAYTVKAIYSTSIKVCTNVYVCTRCDRPRVDVVICDVTEGKIFFRKNGESWLVKHGLYCDVAGEFVSQMVAE